MPDYEVRPATAENWSALERLFGPSGASNGCWCAYWILGAAYHRRDRGLNHDLLRDAVVEGPSPGLLAFESGADVARAPALGWARLTPRAELDWLNRRREFTPLDDLPVLSLPCFYVAREHRGARVATALISAAAHEGATRGVPALEAYPVDPAIPGATKNAFTGYLPTFVAAGFREVARRSASRPIVRLAL